MSTFTKPLFYFVGSILFMTCSHALSEELNLTPSTIFIAGDSTAASYDDPIQQGWGGVIEQYFNPNQLKIVNYASPGRSTRTFIREGIWQTLISQVSAGDIVLIQFGHNDSTPINDETRARGSLSGIGTEYVDIDNQLTKQAERVYTFGHYIRQMVNEVRAKGAHPILMSLTLRNVWTHEKIERASGLYSYWMYQVALSLNTRFIDVSNAAADHFEALGKAKTDQLYIKDHTHFNAEAAHVYSRIIVASLKGLRPTLPAQYYSNNGMDVESYPWTFVRLPFVEDPHHRSVFMVGDSTVRNGRGDGGDGQWGWGDFVARHFENRPINFVNRAVGGLSSRTYVTGGHWQRALNMMKAGDIVLIQFGHNDAGKLNDDTRARGTIRGTSDEYEDIQNMLTGHAERVYSYGWYLRKMIGEAKAKGIIPIVCSPVPRKKWNENQTLIAKADNSYPLWAEKVARQSATGFIDLHSLVAEKYNQMGLEAVNKMFADEHTHTSAEGAALTGEIVAQKLQQILGN